MPAYALAVSLLLVVLLIWSALHQRGLLSRRDAAAPAPREGRPQGPPDSRRK
jgi:hypothetical protein